jgi:hypothetical protein
MGEACTAYGGEERFWEGNVRGQSIWEDNIGIDFQEIVCWGVMDMIHLVEDRDR